MKLPFAMISIVLAFGLFSVAYAPASTASTYLYLNSQPGDYVGQGKTQTLTPADGTFSVSNTSDSVNVIFNSSGQFWILQFGSPVNSKFGRAEYEGATRTAFRSPTAPGV